MRYVKKTPHAKFKVSDHLGRKVNESSEALLYNFGAIILKVRQEEISGGDRKQLMQKNSNGVVGAGSFGTTVASSVIADM